MQELYSYDNRLAYKPKVLVVTKMDCDDADKKYTSFLEDLDVLKQEGTWLQFSTHTFFARARGSWGELGTRNAWGLGWCSFSLWLRKPFLIFIAAAAESTLSARSKAAILIRNIEEYWI